MNPEPNEVFQPEIRVKKLKLENFRGFEQLELEFHCDLTVLIGENGAGKTAILDCLAILLTVFQEELIKRERYLGEDINILDIKKDKFETTNEISLLVTPRGEEGERGEMNWDISFNNTKNNSPKTYPVLLIMEWAAITSQNLIYSKDSPSTAKRNFPVLIYYSISMAAFINFIDFKDARYNFETDILTIYDHALDKKAFNFTYFFEWYRWQENIEKQLGKNPTLDQVRQAIYSLLSDEHNQFANLAINWLNNPSGEMLIQKNATVLNINQLSSGEKTLLALVADLARRLAIANPHREQPLTGNGIVLIDEIDLHLHPRWQRHVIPRLRKTFPNCQFIVTTHSPLVLSQVKRENVVILENFQVVKNTPYTFGRDNNSILYELMAVKQRPDDMQKQLDKVYELLDDDNKAAAQKLLEQLSQDLGENDTTIIRAYHHLAFMDEADETD